MNLKGTMKGIDGAIEFRTSPINTNIKSESLTNNREDFFVTGELSYTNS